MHRCKVYGERGSLEIRPLRGLNVLYVEETTKVSRCGELHDAGFLLSYCVTVIYSVATELLGMHDSLNINNDGV